MTKPVPRLLLVDNYDSFTYNLVQAFLVLGAEVLVHRNDAITVEQAQALQPTHLCISPGPGTPQGAGVSMDMIRAFAGHIPVLGVCLGHQSIVEVFGGEVVECEQHVAVLGQAFRRLRVLGLIVGHESVERFSGRFARVGHPDLMQHVFRFGLFDFGEFVENIRSLVYPTALVPCCRINFI